MSLPDKRGPDSGLMDSARLVVRESKALDIQHDQPEGSK